MINLSTVGGVFLEIMKVNNVNDLVAPIETHRQIFCSKYRLSRYFCSLISYNQPSY